MTEQELIDMINFLNNEIIKKTSEAAQQYAINLRLQRQLDQATQQLSEYRKAEEANVEVTHVDKEKKS